MNTNPSPWSIQSGGGRLGSLLTVLDANGLPVASMRRQYLKTGYVTPAPDDARRLGNARLIASAPDLLAFADWVSRSYSDKTLIRAAGSVLAMAETGAPGLYPYPWLEKKS